MPALFNEVGGMLARKCREVSEVVGVLRLRDDFALRSRHSAQDDKALKDIDN